MKSLAIRPFKNIPKLAAPKLGGLRRRPTVDLTPAEIKGIASRICGDREETEKIARRFLALRLQYRPITLPEAIFYWWCEKQRLNFKYQAEAFGGRSRFGGSVPDFWLPDQALVVRIQGNYWHGMLERARRDAEDKIRLASAVIEGQRVGGVVDLWESKLYSCQRDMAMRLAVQGVEVGK